MCVREREGHLRGRGGDEGPGKFAADVGSGLRERVRAPHHLEVDADFAQRRLLAIAPQRLGFDVFGLWFGV